MMLAPGTPIRFVRSYEVPGTPCTVEEGTVAAIGVPPSTSSRELRESTAWAFVAFDTLGHLHDVNLWIARSAIEPVA